MISASGGSLSGPGSDQNSDFLRMPVHGPGPSFSELLQGGRASPGELPGGLHAPEGTTVLALRYEQGVIVAGDRRATEGFQIAHRSIEKVFAADDMSAVAIAGAAGPAVEMVRLFQTELEHYEKVEGERLTLEGKANKLVQMIRANLPAAMQGLVVVPLFAGFDDAPRRGRIFKYDVTGGRYEEDDYHATGSGGKDARSLSQEALPRRTSPAKRPSRSRSRRCSMPPTRTSAPAGPDLMRGIFPTVVAISSDGHRSRCLKTRSGGSSRSSSPSARRRCAARDPHRRRPPPAERRAEPMPMPYYVSPEQLMRDKADYARKGIARGKSVIVLEYADGILFMAENPSATLHKISEIYDRIAFAGVGKFNEFEQLRIGGIRLVDIKGY